MSTTSTAPGGGGADPRRGSPEKAGPYWLVVTATPETVIVRVDAELDLSASVRLGAILTDLIIGQGNLAVAVDLRGLRQLDPAALEVFGVAAAAVEARGGTLTVRGLPLGSVGAFTARGLGRLIAAGPAGRRDLQLAPPMPSGRGRHPAGSALRRGGPGKMA
ncbi:MAG: hypothetical protein QOG44_83 [Acidimicrobiaceae bacterium]|nr:hypothetical protein [Acidimicrobiaceae bacterium]